MTQMDYQIPYNDDERVKSHLSKTQHLERAYEETLRKADVIVKDEAARRLKVRILALEHDNDDLHEELAQEEDRIDELEQAGEELRKQLEEAQESASMFEVEMRTQAREINNLKVELNAMNGMTTDSTKRLTEKLVLARELATLKPELEHLRSQSAYQQIILSEKLALQRQVSTLEVELETEKRASKRASRKNHNEEKEVELQAQVEDLRKDLAREKRETEDTQKQLSVLKAELESEKCALKRALSKVHDDEREVELQRQVEGLERDLTRERRNTEKARKQINDLEFQLEEMEKRASKLIAKKTSNGEKELELLSQLEEAQKGLASERREKEKIRKEAEKELEFSEARRSALESKLEQMRAKLRSTKEQLKECQVELAQARVAKSKADGTSKTGDLPAKTSRKRPAVEMSTDDAIGTPDGVMVRGKRPTARRGWTDQTMLGEKSMFSITPYLNRTVSMAPDSLTRNEPEPAEDNDMENELGSANQEAESEPGNPIEALANAEVSTPSAPPKAKAKAKGKISEMKLPAEKNVLAEAKASTSNKKTTAKKPRTISTLEKVLEEEDENKAAVTAPRAAKATVIKPDALKTKLTLKEAEDTEPKKKKRKLLGGGKSLFDEDDGEATKRPPKVILGPPKLLGRGGIAGPKGSLKGGLATAGSFGGFSPLKRDRRGTGASFLA